MKERLKVLDFKYNVLTVFFIFILFISLLAPLSGNDWINYVNGKSGIIESFKNLTFNNGGLLSDFFAGIFTNSKGIFDILFASLMTFTFYNVIPLFGNIAMVVREETSFTSEDHYYWIFFASITWAIKCLFYVVVIIFVIYIIFLDIFFRTI